MKRCLTHKADTNYRFDLALELVQDAREGLRRELSAYTQKQADLNVKAHADARTSSGVMGMRHPFHRAEAHHAMPRSVRLFTVTRT